MQQVSEEDVLETAMAKVGWRYRDPAKREQFRSFLRTGEAGDTPACF